MIIFYKSNKNRTKHNCHCLNQQCGGTIGSRSGGSGSKGGLLGGEVIVVNTKYYLVVVSLFLERGRLPNAPSLYFNCCKHIFLSKVFITISAHGI